MGVKETLLERRLREGIEIGREEGREKGRYQEALEIACELKKEGLAIDFIAKITKLPIGQIEEL